MLSHVNSETSGERERERLEERWVEAGRTFSVWTKPRVQHQPSVCQKKAGREPRNSEQKLSMGQAPGPAESLA